MDSPYQEERLRILEMVERGDITPAEGVQLIQALTGEHPPGTGPSALQADRIDLRDAPRAPGGELAGGHAASEAAALGSAPADPADDHPAPQPSLPGKDRWRYWWQVPLWLGAAIALSGGFLMYQAALAQGYGFWFFCALVPVLGGLALFSAAWLSRNSRWIHIRIQQSPGERPEHISLSFPLPLRLSAWVLRTFGRFLPQLEHTGLDELILALEQEASPDQPLYLAVEDEGDGERVEVYIG